MVLVLNCSGKAPLSSLYITNYRLALANFAIVQIKTMLNAIHR